MKKKKKTSLLTLKKPTSKENITNPDNVVDYIEEYGVEEFFFDNDFENDLSYLKPYVAELKKENDTDIDNLEYFKFWKPIIVPYTSILKRMNVENNLKKFRETLKERLIRDGRPVNLDEFGNLILSRTSWNKLRRQSFVNRRKRRSYLMLPKLVPRKLNEFQLEVMSDKLKNTYNIVSKAPVEPKQILQDNKKNNDDNRKMIKENVKELLDKRPMSLEEVENKLEQIGINQLANKHGRKLCKYKITFFGYLFGVKNYTKFTSFISEIFSIYRIYGCIVIVFSYKTLNEMYKYVSEESESLKLNKVCEFDIQIYNDVAM